MNNQKSNQNSNTNTLPIVASSKRTGGLAEFLDSLNNYYSISALLEKYNIEDKEGFYNQIESDAFIYEMNKFDNHSIHKKVFDNFFSSEILSIEEKEKVNNSIRNAFGKVLDLLLVNIEAKFINMEIEMVDEKDLNDNKITYAWKYTKGFRQELEKNGVTGSLEMFYRCYKALPRKLSHLLEDVKMGGDITCGVFCENYSKISNRPGLMEEKMNVQLRNIVLKHANQVLDMYSMDMSFNKIQKRLTRECIKANEIPPTVKRLDRSLGAESRFNLVPNLLPIKTIKKVLEGADIKLSLVG